MLRSSVLAAAIAASLLLASCASPPPGSDGPATSTPEAGAEASEAPTEPALTNADPRCKDWSSPLLVFELILHPVVSVADFPRPALDATCRWELAAGSNTIRFTYHYEVLWLDADVATFDQVTAAFEAEGATVMVDESHGPEDPFDWITYATISSPDGTGEISLREPTHSMPIPFMNLTWTRA